MYWFNSDGKDKDIFVSTRVRLARNLTDYPFEPSLTESARREIVEKVKGALCDGDYTFTEFSALAENEKASLSEKHLVSPDMMSSSFSAIAENVDDGICVMICEEDHLRIQAIKSGFDLDGAAKSAFSVDDRLDESLSIAFDDKLGYLTHCPTNLGTGMRASVMMFLPALTITEKIRSIEPQLSKLGLTVRGINGEGSYSKGCLYQISNCVTLGVTEEETINNLKETVLKIADSERELRKSLYDKNFASLANRIIRSLGTMKYSYMLSSDELYRLYTDVRLGISLGIIDGESEKELDYLLISCMPSTLCGDKKLSAEKRDILRAKTVRNSLKGELNEHKIYSEGAGLPQ